MVQAPPSAASGPVAPGRPYILHGDIGSGSATVEMALAEAGQAVELREVPLEGDHQLAAAHRALNPMGRIPTLVLPDGMVMTESFAILLTIADRHPDAALLPPAPEPDRARALRWMALLAGEFYPHVTRADYPGRFSADPGHAEAIGQRVEDFIAMVIECEDTTAVGQEKRARFLLRQRISHGIRDRLTDADLAPRSIADRNGISLSYLHRIFNEHGTTVSSYILDQRLQLAYEKLANPLGPRLTVSEVAYSVGFKSASHFCKAFAARYNMTPRDVRQR